jgi:cytolysin-activating lysine-acyltransferase
MHLLASGQSRSKTVAPGTAAEESAASAPTGAPNVPPEPKVDAELAQKLQEFRQHLQKSFAQVVMTMMATPRYQHCSLAELEHLVLDPLLRNRIAIAQAIAKEGAARSQDDAVVGIAVWAKVSPEVDAKIREQIKAGVFPIRLTAQDWASGDIAWLLDVIAPNQKLAAAVLANFKQVAGEGRLFVHPVVRRLADAELAHAG